MATFLSISIFSQDFLDCQVMLTSFLTLGDNLVGWSYERCCFNGTCLQSGKSNMWHVGAV